VTRIFVSSTIEDLRREREAVEKALRRMQDVFFAGMEYFGSRPETPMETSLDEVDRSDIYVGIFAQRYGSGITEAEYRRARKKGIPLLIYFKDDSAPVEPHHREIDPERIARLEALKQELKDSHSISSFTSPDDLATKVLADLHREIGALASKKKIIEEHELLLALDSRRKSVSYIYFVAMLTTMIGSLFWILGLESWVVPLIIALLFGYAVPHFLEYLRVKSDYGRLIVGWCQSNSHLVLFFYLFLELGTLLFRYSLDWYPVFSGVRFSTHLEDISKEFFWRLVVLVGATTVLHLPTVEKISVKGALVSIREKATVSRKIILSTFLIVVASSATIVRIDIVLLLATPRISLIETSEVLGDVVHVEYTGYGTNVRALQASVLNEKRIHFLSPRIPLLNNLSLSLMGNSSRPSSITFSTVGAAKIVSNEKGHLIGLRILVKIPAPPQSEVVVRYHNELEIDKVLDVFLNQTEIMTFPNGTKQLQRVISLTNVCRYNVELTNAYWIYVPSRFCEVKIDKQLSNAEIYFSESAGMLYMPGTTRINPKGYVRIVITYNQV